MSNTAEIRICKNLEGVLDLEACNESDPFNIVGSITNVYVKNAVLDGDPGTPINLAIATDKWITWDYKGSLGNVNIYYTINSTGGPPDWNLIPDPDAGGPRTSGANVPIDDGTAGEHGSFVGGGYADLPNHFISNVRCAMAGHKWETDSKNASR